MDEPLGNPGIGNWRTGNLLFRHARYTEALREYTRAIDLDPEQHAFYHNRALAFAAVGDFDGALADVWRALELRPDSQAGATLCALLGTGSSVSRASGSVALDGPSGPSGSTRESEIRIRSERDDDARDAARTLAPGAALSSLQTGLRDLLLELPDG